MSMPSNTRKPSGEFQPVSQSLARPDGQLPLCLNVSSHVESRFGGIATSMVPLEAAVREGGRYRSSWAAFCSPDEKSPEASERFSRWPVGHGSWAKGALLRGVLQQRAAEVFAQADVVHLHGLWQAHSWVGGSLARQTKRPYVVSAHGMLDEWAFRHRGWKKKLYSAAVERANLRGAACLRALTETEAEDYRRYGLANPVAVIPNGVVLAPEATSEAFLARFPELADKTRLLFMGRLHPKKGVEMLVEVWGRLAKEFPEAVLLVAGPDEVGMLPRLQAAAEAAGVSQQIRFLGMVRGKERDSLLAAADLFLLPSFSEGFSVATLEALGAAVPVLITTKCNFPEIARKGCGWVISPEAAELEAAMRKFFVTPKAERAVMGETGREMVRKEYDWRSIASQFAELFDWVRGGPRPANVRLHTT